MGNLISLITLIGPIIKLLLELISLFKHPEQSSQIVDNASKNVKIVKLAAKPTTPITIPEVQEMLNSQTDDVDDLTKAATASGKPITMTQEEYKLAIETMERLRKES